MTNWAKTIPWVPLTEEDYVWASRRGGRTMLRITWRGSRRLHQQYQPDRCAGVDLRYRLVHRNLVSIERNLRFVLEHV